MLVLQVSAMAKGGEVFMLDMGQQVRILDIAEDLIRSSGLEPGKDIEIVFTGVRPGEKMGESMWQEGAVYVKTDHPQISRVFDELWTVPPDLSGIIEELTTFAMVHNNEACRDWLCRIFPTMLDG